jgi:hypothetical protein
MLRARGAPPPPFTDEKPEAQKEEWPWVGWAIRPFPTGGWRVVVLVVSAPEQGLTTYT